MPVRPVEVMIAKIVPYIGIGYVQVRLILAVSIAVFQLLIRGSIGLLILALGLFIAEASQCRIEHLERAVEDELAFDMHLQRAAVFLEFPGVQSAMGGQTQIDAVVRG